MPKWALVDEKVAAAGFRQAVRTLPTAVAVVCRLSWQTSPWLTLLAALVHVLSGGVTAFGLLATADVFSSLLREVPTPDRVLQAVPAIAVVVASYGVRALLDTAVAAVEGTLRPSVVRAADDEVTESLVHVRLLAFEDADFRELARQGARYGVNAIETSLRQLADLLAATISVLAAMITAGLLNPWLNSGAVARRDRGRLVSGRVAKLRYQHFLDNVARNLRKYVVEQVATQRELALERHALTLQDRLLGEYRRIAHILMRDEIRLAHRSNVVRLTGRAAAGARTAAAYFVLGVLLYTGTMNLALAGTAVLAMRTASTALSNAMRAINPCTRTRSISISTTGCSSRRPSCGTRPRPSRRLPSVGRPCPRTLRWGRSRRGGRRTTR